MTHAASISSLPSNQSNTSRDLASLSKIQEWCGHSVCTVKEELSQIGNGILKAAHKIFTGMDRVAGDTNASAAVFRKLDQHVFRFLEHLGGIEGGLTRFSTFIRHNVALIDFVQLIGDVNYFVRGKFKEKRNEKGQLEKPRDSAEVIAGHAAFAVANTGGSLLWLQQLNILSLSKMASKIGEVRVFSCVPKVIASIPVIKNLSGLQKVANAVGEFRAFGFVKHLSCLTITLRALDLGYALYAVDAVKRLLNKHNNQTQTISAGIDLSSYLAELMLSALVLAGVTNVVGLGVMGLTCITLTVASFLYRVFNENELKPKYQLPAQAAITR
jgi:hypothetical protein